jgi:hypothetical protein
MRINASIVGLGPRRSADEHTHIGERDCRMSPPESAVILYMDDLRSLLLWRGIFDANSRSQVRRRLSTSPRSSRNPRVLAGLRAASLSLPRMLEGQPRSRRWCRTSWPVPRAARQGNAQHHQRGRGRVARPRGDCAVTNSHPRLSWTYRNMPRRSRRGARSPGARLPDDAVIVWTSSLDSALRTCRACDPQQ